MVEPNRCDDDTQRDGGGDGYGNYEGRLAGVAAVTVAVAAPLGATVKSWPVPVRVTLSELPDALSVMVNIPVRLPPDVETAMRLPRARS